MNRQNLRLLFTIFVLNSISAIAQSPAFTYQGRLDSGGSPANGTYDLRFTLYDEAGGGVQRGGPFTNGAIVVSAGLFTVTLNFGADVFNGAPRWLELAVRTNGSGPFSILNPRQLLTPTPYAVAATKVIGPVAASQLSGTIPAASLNGTYSGAVVLNNADNIFSGVGAGLTSLDASRLSSGTVPDARLAPNLARTNQVWLLGGNEGTSADAQFLGTADEQPLELRVFNQRALRLEARAISPNVIGGFRANYAAPAIHGATIGGGGAQGFSNRVTEIFTTIGGGLANFASGQFATVGGGYDNTASGTYATVGGGFTNRASNQSATVAGGARNSASGVESTVAGGLGNSTPGSWATVGGGTANRALSDFATVSGGWNNTASGSAATVSGGENNSATNSRATVAGGIQNIASGQFATVGGGGGNTASGARTTISGGEGNVATGSRATIGGGEANTASGSYASIPGGILNNATHYAFAAGRRAKANHQGAFVWADATNADFASSANNQFLIRAAGGVGIGTTNPSAPLSVSGADPVDAFSGQLVLAGTSTAGASDTGAGLRFSGNDGVIARDWGFIRGLKANSTAGNTVSYLSFGTRGFSGGPAERMRLDITGLTVNGTFVSSSDRNLKENFRPVDPQQVLAKVAALPITQWNFIGDAATPHVGPMAQDFRAAFGLGTDDKHIATVDADGVALAAIQGLNHKVEMGKQKAESLEQRLEQKETEIGELNQRLAALERLVTALNPIGE
jgi:hypothetical protein